MQECLVPFFFFNVVATCGYSSHNRVTKKVGKQVEGKIKNLKID